MPRDVCWLPRHPSTCDAACMRDGSTVIDACMPSDARGICASCLDTHRRVTQHVCENQRRPSALPDFGAGWPDGHRMPSAARDACVREPSERPDDLARWLGGSMRAGWLDGHRRMPSDARTMCAVCLDTHRRVTQHVGENHRRPSVLPDLCSGWPDGHRMTSATRDACVREPSERLDDFA